MKRRYSNILTILLSSSLLLNNVGPIVSANSLNSEVISTNTGLNEILGDLNSEISNSDLELGITDEENHVENQTESITDEESQVDNQTEGITDQESQVENQTENITDEESQVENQIQSITDEVESNSIEQSISSKATIASGVIQFELEPVVGQEGKENNVTTAQIKRAISNLSQPNRTLKSIAGGVSSHDTYINASYGKDALFLGEEGDYYRIYISGYEGLVKKKESNLLSVSLDLNNDGKYVTYSYYATAVYYPFAKTLKSGDSYNENGDIKLLEFSDDLLPYFNADDAISNRATSTAQYVSYYRNENGDLYHYLPSNVVTGGYSKFLVGAAPSFMKSNTKYYSYDGVYFYNSPSSIRVNGSGSVNVNNPYFNYYQFIPFRSKSNYTSTNIDNYTTSMGYTIYAASCTNNTGKSCSNASNQSKLVNAGKYFENVQDKYGVNGALQYAMAIHESGKGRSYISMTKNNLFGMKAYDSNTSAATSFSSVEEGIYTHAKEYISWGYTDPIDDSRYFGSHVGNKGSGMNVKYASDPYWGEKIAGWYYKVDKANGLKDYNYYTIGVKTVSTNYNVRLEANTNSKVVYKTYNGKSGASIRNYPVLIIGKENNFYKIQSDTPIVNSAASYSGKYVWEDSIVYISTDAISYVNKSSSSYTRPITSNSLLSKYKKFLTHLYSTLLNRNPDQEGLNYWATALVNQKISVGDLIRVIINEKEFKGRNLSDSEYIEVLYLALFGRSADNEGKTYWLNMLSKGLSRDYLLVNYINSNEFAKVCNSYGIVRVMVNFTNIADNYPKITEFVNNFYVNGYNRNPDQEGLNYWVSGFVNKKITANNFAVLMFSSDEIKNKKLNNSEYVERVYKTLLMRSSDASGKAYWVGALNSGVDRVDFVKIFTEAPEFENLCNRLGIKR